MKVNPILIAIAMFFTVLMTSCEKAIMPGLSEDEISMEDLLGGWGDPEILCYMAHSAVPGADLLRERLQENLERRADQSALYFTKDTAYFIQKSAEGYYFVRARSTYELKTDPMRLEFANDYLMFDSYAPRLYVKKDEEMMCFYLLKEEAMQMIEKDGSVSAFMGLIRSKIDDAQFEFYYTRNQLKIYNDIDKGDYNHYDWD